MERRLCGIAGSLTAVGLLVLSGCGGAEESARPPVPAEASAGSSAEAVEPEAGSPTAADTLLLTAAGFRENRPVAVWQALPPEHQGDVNELLRSFGERMDVELWNRVRSAAGKLAGLLRARREWIVNWPPLRDDPAFTTGAGKQVVANWDVAAGLLEALAAIDLETLRKFDGERAFAEFDAEDLQRLRQFAVLLPDDNPYSRLEDLIAGADVRGVDATDDRARVEVVPGQGEPRVFEMVRIEGRWFPAAWQASWDSEIAAARQKIEVELAPDVLTRKKRQVLPILTAFEQSVDRLAMAGDEPAFHDLLDREVLPAISAAGAVAPAASSGGAGEPSPEPDGPRRSVMLQFAKPLDERTEEAVAQALIGLADRADAIVLPVSGGRGMGFEVSPVANVEAFARRIPFGRVTDVDAGRRTISVELQSGGSSP